MRRLIWVAWILLQIPASAAATPRRPALHWTRGRDAEACIDPLTLAERVEALTGPVFTPNADYAVEGHVSARPGGFRLRLSVTAFDRAPLGERVVEHRGADCRAFDDAIVFLIALTIDPDLDLEKLTRDPSLEGHAPEDVLLRELDANPPRPVVLAPVPSELEPAPAPSSVHAGPEASLALAMAADALRGVSLGPIVGVSMPVARWLEVAAQLRVLARVGEYDIDGARTLRAQSFSFAPLLCLRSPGDRTSLRGCLGPEPSFVRARGLGFDEGQRGRLSVWGVVAKLELTQHVDEQWSLVLQAFVRMSLEQKSFVYNSDLFGKPETVAQLARWMGGVAFGVSYRFRSGMPRAASTHLRNSEVPP